MKLNKLYSCGERSVVCVIWEMKKGSIILFCFFVFLCIGNVVIFVKWHNVKQAYLTTSLHDNDNY